MSTPVVQALQEAPSVVDTIETPSAIVPGPDPIVATDDTAAASDAPVTDADQTEAERPEIDIPSLVASGSQCVSTNVQYNLYMIDGYPYLLRAPDRRSTRRHRAAEPMTSLVSPAPAATSTSTSSASRPVVGAQLRQHHVDLPATAAIPVRTAEGQRALILSPEGVRAMAAQGVNVDRNTQREQRFMGITSSQVRNLLRNGIPHSWLFLKLTFLVFLLGSNSSWNRLLVLNLAAAIIFFWQSGIFAAVWGNWRGQVHADANITGTPVSAHANDTGVENNTVAPPSPNTALLQHLGRAFFSSILPGVSQPTTPVVQQEGFQPPQPQPQPETQNTQTESSTTPITSQEDHAMSSNESHSEKREQEPSAPVNKDDNVDPIDNQHTSN